VQVQQIVDLLAKRACRADTEGVCPATLGELAKNVAPFLEPARLSEQLNLLEALAGACGLTTFVFLQHVAAVRYVPDLRGLGGIALAHVRYPGPPCVRAAHHRLNGEAPWFTGWGLLEQAVVAAHAEDGPWLYLVKTRELEASEPLGLCAMGASATVSLKFQDVPGQPIRPFDDPPEPWIDLRDAALPLGAATEALKGLPTGALHEQRDDLRQRLYAQRGNPRELRMEAVDLGLRATQANLIVAGGRGNRLDHPAQRLAREALFYAVMAGQKEALVEALSSRAGGARPCGARA